MRCIFNQYWLTGTNTQDTQDIRLVANCQKPFKAFFIPLPVPAYSIEGPGKKTRPLSPPPSGALSIFPTFPGFSQNPPWGQFSFPDLLS